MRSGQFFCAAIVSLVVGGVAAAAESAQPADKEPAKGPQFVAMFNGHDLSGWEGVPGGWWVEDGAITAECTPEKPCTKCHYLLWRGGKPGDFELKAKFRLVGNNSGIQFRSRELPEFDTWGYQADMEVGPQWTGALFQHDRWAVSKRGEKTEYDADGKKTVTQFADPAELQKVIKPGEWNEYEILAHGPEVILKINGVVMTHAIDRDAKLACRSGVIGLQMHPGPPMKVQFKDLLIKILD